MLVFESAIVLYYYFTIEYYQLEHVLSRAHHSDNVLVASRDLSELSSGMESKLLCVTPGSWVEPEKSVVMARGPPLGGETSLDDLATRMNETIRKII